MFYHTSLSLEYSCGHLHRFPNFVTLVLYHGRYSVSFVPKNEIPPGQYALDAGGNLNFTMATSLSSYNLLHLCACS